MPRRNVTPLQVKCQMILIGQVLCVLEFRAHRAGSTRCFITCLATDRQRQMNEEQRRRNAARSLSLSVPVSKLQLLEITSHQRNPGQRQHRAARDASTSFTSYQRKLPVLRQQSKDLIDKADARRPCSDVPHPLPHPISLCRPCLVKSCKIFCKQWQ